MSSKATNTTLKFTKSVKAHIPFDLTGQQDELIHHLSDFMADDHHPCFILCGFAGTGKSTVVSALTKALKEKEITTVLMAPTGRAAKVISLYSQQNAFTVHKQIYKRRVNASGFSEFIIAPNVHARALFIVDEASMIADVSIGKGAFSNRSLLSDLLQFVKQGFACKLLLVGDTAQLPPVGLDESPALDERVINAYGFTNLKYELTHVVRQAENSGILSNATEIRNKINQPSIDLPRINANFEDVELVNGYDLQDTLETALDQNGKQNVVVITRSNKRALLFNQQVRARVFWYESLLVEGDILMVVKNNYFWSNSREIAFIANGDLVEVVRIHNYINRFGLTFAEVSLCFVDYPSKPELETILLLDCLEEPHPAFPRDKMKELWQNILLDYAYEKNKGKRYAYAITCHKAQGGQWPVVFIDHGYLTKEMMGNSFLRWLYTATTRAQDELYFLNFHPAFLEKES